MKMSKSGFKKDRGSKEPTLDVEKAVNSLLLGERKEDRAPWREFPCDCVGFRITFTIQGKRKQKIWTSVHSSYELKDRHV